MKGVVVVNVEIDYKTLLDEKNLEALSLYTGKKEVQEIIQEHMNDLGKKISEVLDGNPLIKYEIRGDVVKEDDVSETAHEVEVEDDKTEEDIVESDESDIPTVEAELMPTLDKDYIKKLDNDLLEISSQGIPQEIVINPLVIKQFAEKYNIPKGQTVDTYKGFKVQVGEMEEAYEIRYKDYNSQDELSMSRGF